MSGKAEEAGGYFRQGYNCCQAVVLAFAEEAGLTAKEAALLGSSFGGGMGRLREVCGTVSGMLMVAGLLKGYVSPKDREGKTTHYALVQKLADEFRKKNGSIVCRELLGIEGRSPHVPEARTDAYYRKRPCGELVECAADILAQELGVK